MQQSGFQKVWKILLLLHKFAHFKGLRLFFLSNFPEAMFIQGATSIPESRVKYSTETFSDFEGRLILKSHNLSTLESGIDVAP